MNISLCHLVKVIPHNNYKVALRNIADVYAFLDKLGEKMPRMYDWIVNAAINIRNEGMRLVLV